MLPYEKIKLVFVGDSNVGKTTIIQRISNPNFKSMRQTIGVDLTIHTQKVYSNLVKFHIWDTGGSEKNRDNIMNYTRDAHGVIIVHDGTQPLEPYISNWISTIKRYTSCPLFLIHTKDVNDKKITNYPECIDLGYIDIHEKFNEILFSNIYFEIQRTRGF
jgi:small GTP-binding protein